jgi:hypothetical protein
MNVTPAHTLQALDLDELNAFVVGPMKQHWRRNRGQGLKINIDAVTIVGSELRLGFVERKPALLAARDHLPELFTGNGEAVRGARGEHRIDRNPAPWLQYEPQTLWLMTQVFAQVLADLDATSVV